MTEKKERTAPQLKKKLTELSQKYSRLIISDFLENGDVSSERRKMLLQVQDDLNAVIAICESRGRY